MKIKTTEEVKPVEVSKTDVEKLEERDVGKLEGDNAGEINQIAVQQVLEIEGGDYENEIETLIEWAKQKTGSEDYMDLKWAVRDLRLKLGTPTFGDPIKNMARFARLDLDEDKIKKEKESYR